MPEQWMYDVLGDEARPRPGFEDQLARELHHEWSGRRTPWRAIAWGAAAAALLIGVVAVVAKDDTKQIAPADTTVPVSAVPSTTAATETTEATTATTATPTTTAPSTTVEPPTTGVGLYLFALATGDYATAAQLLNEGGLSLEDRADIRPLFRPEFGLVPGLTNRDVVASALEKWCAVALCVQPTEVTDLADGRWTRAVFPAPNGPRASLFTDYEFEGQTGVTGLPPMLPSSADSAAIIDCPTDGVRTVVWADLDGDGWIEQLVGRSVGDAGSPEDGVENFVISACGTALQVEPFAITGDGLAVYPVNPGIGGPDTVLIGFLEGVPNGSIYALDGQSIVQQQGPGGPTRWAFAPPFAADPAETFGCAVITEGQPPVLVNRTYRLIGGNELSNSTSMELTTVEVFTGASKSETFTLPAQEAEAGEALIGHCNGLPVMTN